ncbi:hypothetical protein LXL04_008606 [Taraxacum kok-saghyz]
MCRGEESRRRKIETWEASPATGVAAGVGAVEISGQSRFLTAMAAAATDHHYLHHCSLVIVTVLMKCMHVFEGWNGTKEDMDGIRRLDVFGLLSLTRVRTSRTFKNKSRTLKNTQEHSRTMKNTQEHIKNTIAFRENISNLYNALSRREIWAAKRCQMGCLNLYPSPCIYTTRAALNKDK